jgi:sugar phosphate isomerase/epimerase
MQLGIFAKTYTRPTVEEVFNAVAADGFTAVHFNFASAGLPSLPDAVDPAVLARIRSAAAERGLAIETLSGTFNMIHPDPAVRRHGLERLRVLAAACAGLGTQIVTLCTGTRDPENMWRRHPDNDTDAAWQDLIASMTSAAAIAAEHGVLLGIEPEPGNVVSSAARARRLLEEIDSDSLGIVLDPANLIEGIPVDRIDATIDEAFALLGERTISAHGKDRDAAGAVVPPGRGIVPWPRFLIGLSAAGFSGPLILHGLEEADVPESVAHLRSVGG